MNFIASLIYRPPRCQYKKITYDSSIQYEDGSFGKRITVQFENKRNQTICGSFYISPSPAPGNPCLIYLHGNASSQNEGAWIPFMLCPHGVNVLCIDTSGSGNSDGEYISLGYYERDDVKAAMDFLREKYNVKAFSLWGRSMGASIAAWCAADNFDLSSVVIDSAYESVREIIKDLHGNSWLLWLLSKMVLPFVNRRVKKAIGISIDDIDVTPNLGKAVVPALFVHASYDSFIKVREARSMFAKYGGKTKFMMTTKGDHNSNRPHEVIYTITCFILSNFDIDDEEIEIEQTQSDNSSAHYNNAFDMMKDM
ncbi:Clan SC, family S9, unassigned serine peptidase [Tritrichomonas foetus]|uniref:Clan SC, family S9, unassigned serine peptidase n=1 Tax=Tritrichomonas foetus TaxID=1144522 RepID=A0A1J4K2D2_9EUKA|nr:Clan SC, family S9, unassigned serine peptidase [Tritrichomonas foetus]|eukprot:OHT05355.1 Clan SC, family S9, unassigned serine peptidase [Tritrichomonas foetus]